MTEVTDELISTTIQFKAEGFADVSDEDIDQALRLVAASLKHKRQYVRCEVGRHMKTPGLDFCLQCKAPSIWTPDD